jgi:CDP-4-dehydro-6-deoxyglucose reductase, E3
MTSKVIIQSTQQEFPVENGETLLEAALRAGLPLNYHCASGTCGYCLAQILHGQPNPCQPHDFAIREADRKRGVVLLCRTTTDTDLIIETQQTSNPACIPTQTIVTTVDKLQHAAKDVLVLHLRTPRSQTLQFLSGQHMTLAIDGIGPRNKSIASCPCNGMNIQFHIRHVAGDEFSDYVFNRLQLKQRVLISGPRGQFTLDARSQRPALFLAYETGFATTKSLIEHTISLEMVQPMHLYWATRRRGDHYLENQCRAWQDALDNFRYTEIANDQATDVQQYRQGDYSINGSMSPASQDYLIHTAHQVVRDYPDLSGHDVYVSGHVHAMTRARALLLQHHLPEDRLFVDSLERF